METVIKINYFTLLDVFAELGGLNASVNSIMGALGALFLISYFHSLSSLIKRKYQHKISVQLVKQNQKVIEEIKRQFEKSIENERNDQVKKDLVKQVSELEELLKDDFMESYGDTEDRLVKILKFVKKYRPEALEDVFAYIGATKQTKWE